jgi:hypothetical protein
LLTNRKDVSLVDLRKSADFGLDFLVAIGGQNGAGVRQFGVELKSSASDKGKPNRRLIAQAIKQGRKCGPYPFPVVLVYVAAETSQMWYAWIAKPTNANGQEKLALTESTELEPLDDDSLAGIIREVHRWYDGLYSPSLR